MGTIVDNPEVVVRQGIEARDSAVPDVSVGTNSFSQLYLHAFATQGELLHHVRTQTLKEEVARYPEILRKWQSQQDAVQLLIESEAGLADQSSSESLPTELIPRLEEIAADPLLQKTFSAVPFSFEIVNVDTLVASQRHVNLDYVTQLQESYEGKSSVKDLAEICLSPRREMPPIQHLETPNNAHVFSSA